MPLSQLLKGSDRESKAEIQLILNAVVEGLCGLDQSGNVTFCNDAFLRMTGYRSEEILGNNLHELVHHSHPDGTRYAAEECPFCKALNARRAIHIAGELFRRKDGVFFPVEYWMHPLEKSSNLTEFLATVQDITEIEQTRQILRRSEEKFRKIVSSVPDVVWTSDQHGRTIYVSPQVETLTGYSEQEVCAGGGELRLGCIHPEDFGRVQKGYRALFEKPCVFDEEYRIRRKDGVWIWIHDRAVSTYVENGVSDANGVFTDVTSRKQAEAELKSKTAFLEAQANATIDGILVVDGRGRRLLLNQRLIELLKVPPEIAIDNDDRHLLEYVVTLIKDPESFLDRINHLNRHPGDTGRDEIELKDGRTLDRYSAPVVDAEGNYYGRIWTFRDITEQKRAEQSLQRSEEKFRSLAENIHEVFWMMSASADEILYVSPAYDQIWNRPREILYQNPMAWAEAIHPDDIEHAHAIFARQMLGERIESEYRILTPEGQEKWISDRAFPVRDQDGQITRVVGIAEEITARKRAERELRLAKASVENASDAIFWADSAGHFVYANEAACRSVGWSREELVARSIHDINPLRREELWERFRQDVAARASITFESQHQTKQGRLFPVEVTANHLEFDGQEYIFAFVRDITERRELEGQLRHAQKLEGIGQLAAGIAHEINTPTQFVTDNLTFLRQSWKATNELLELYRSAIRNSSHVLPPGVAENLDEAERSRDLDFIVAEVPRAIDQSLDGTQRVAKIIRAMKEFSHPDSVDKTATDLNRAVESTITVARNEWKYVAEIATEFDETLPAVVCYPGDINQVILNLLVNAAHSIKEKIGEGEMGRITVRTRRQEELAEITVRDTGMGIPEAIRARIFDPFFTTKDVGKGTGQGLALAHSMVVKKHGGKIWFETELGVGTTFFIALPIDSVNTVKGK